MAVNRYMRIGDAITIPDMNPPSLEIPSPVYLELREGIGGRPQLVICSAARHKHLTIRTGLEGHLYITVND